jgi:Flp pilus assembly protein TadG
VAISLIPILGIAALAIDGGLLMSERRALQRAADAGALAAAIQMYNDWPSQTAAKQGADSTGTAATSAKNTVTDNGYTNNSNGATVTVSIPPTSGACSGKRGYAEVIVTVQQRRYFTLTPLSWGTGPTGPQNMAIWQDVGDQNTFTLSAGGNLNISSGILYVANPNAQVNLSNAASNNYQVGSQVIVGMLQLSGTGGFNINTGPAGAPGRNLYLVE